MAKGKGKVVLVDTDDPEAYEAEHVQGAVNIPYDPTRDTTNKISFSARFPATG